MTSGEPPSPFPPAPEPTGQPPSVGVILLRALLPPLALGVLGSSTVILKRDVDNNVLIGLLILGSVAALINVMHLTMEIVTKPAEPPLGIPRGLSGILLFFTFSVLQIVIVVTAFFGGCICMSALGAKIPGGP